MSGGEILFLVAFIGAMALFAGTLAWGDYQSSHHD
jgi:hypothetical protein